MQIYQSRHTRRGQPRGAPPRVGAELQKTLWLSFIWLQTSVSIVFSAAVTPNAVAIFVAVAAVVAEIICGGGLVFWSKKTYNTLSQQLPLWHNQAFPCLELRIQAKWWSSWDEWKGAWRYRKGSRPGSPHLPGTQGLTCVMSLMVIVSDHILKQTFEDMNIQS